MAEIAFKQIVVDDTHIYGLTDWGQVYKSNYDPKTGFYWTPLNMEVLEE